MSENMRIGLVAPKLSGGGAEYVAYEWATFLTEAGLDVRVILTDGSETSWPANMQVVQLVGTSFLARVKSLRSEISSQNVDVLIGFMPYWNLLALVAAKSRYSRTVKTVLSSHTIESSYGANRGRGFLAQTLLARLVYRFADAFVASSHAVAAEAVARCGIDRSRLWVVQNPVFSGAVERADRSNAQFPMSSRSMDIVVVPGRLVDQKRPALALDVAKAIAAARGVIPEVWFVGEGPAEDGLRRRARELGVAARFEPWNSKWPELVPASAVVLLPSMLEGFGNVLLDATAGGLPVVASSKALGVADAIIPDVTGVLVNGDSVAHYADGVMRAQKIRNIDNATVNRWLNRFTRETSGNQLLSIISGLRS